MKKTAEDIMSKSLITIDLNESVVNAHKVMVGNRIRHLPVTDSSQTIVGLLSDRDVQRCVRYTGKNRSNDLDIELNLDPKISVIDAMSWPVHQVDGETPILEVAQRMLNDKISSLIVDCKKTGKRGILTTDDLLRVLISLLEKEPPRLRLVVNSLLSELYPVSNTLSVGGI